MDLTYLKELYEQGLVCFHESFPTWQEAILAAVKPLVKKGMVTADYGPSILEHVDKFGPYIFLAPHICMPGVCFMKCNQPVIADPDDPEMGAELFFSVAALAEGDHLEAVQRLMKILEDDSIVEALLAVHSEDDFRQLISP